MNPQGRPRAIECPGRVPLPPTEDPTKDPRLPGSIAAAGDPLSMLDDGELLTPGTVQNAGHESPGRVNRLGRRLSQRDQKSGDATYPNCAICRSREESLRRRNEGLSTDTLDGDESITHGSGGRPIC